MNHAIMNKKHIIKTINNKKHIKYLNDKKPVQPFPYRVLEGDCMSTFLRDATQLSRAVFNYPCV